MKKYIYQEFPMQERIAMLQKQCSKSEVKTYNRTLSQSEIEMEKDKYTSNAIEIERQKAELKATVERLKAGITSVENLMVERLERIKTGQTQLTATLYGLVDTAEHRMRFFDGYGEEISNRELTPDERQGKLLLGDDPLGTPRPADEAVDVEHVVVDEEGLAEATEKMYEEENPGMAVASADEIPVDVVIPVQAPQEDKPAKKKTTKKGKKSDDESPL